jgi:hypothetical protein
MPHPTLLLTALLEMLTGRGVALLLCGEVAACLNERHSECGIGATVSEVRILPSSPAFSLTGVEWHGFYDRGEEQLLR